ncbi:MAG: Flp family type IVb pilin [Chloroflexota bacterium]
MDLLRDLLSRRAGPMDGERGQGLAEYALILSLIALLAIVSLVYLGGAVGRLLSNVGTSL